MAHTFFIQVAPFQFFCSENTGDGDAWEAVRLDHYSRTTIAMKEKLLYQIYFLKLCQKQRFTPVYLPLLFG